MKFKMKRTAAVPAALLACVTVNAANAGRETIQQLALLQSLARGYFV